MLEFLDEISGTDRSLAFGVLNAIGFIGSILYLWLRFRRTPWLDNVIRFHCLLVAIGYASGSLGYELLYSDQGSGFWSGNTIVVSGVVITVLYLVSSIVPAMHVLLRLFDASLSAIPLIQIAGKIGCLIRGCCTGTMPFGMDQWARLEAIESIYYGFLFVLLQVFRKRLHVGIASRVYLFALLGWRFLVDFIRTDNAKTTGMLSHPQLLCLIGLTLLLAFSILSHYRNEQLPEIESQRFTGDSA